MSKMIPLHIADQAVANCEAEIQKLREENARLKAEVERMKAMYRDTERWMLVDGEFEAAKVGTYAQLKAEVERLTKAGDAMAADLIGEFGSYNSVYDWNAAKPQP